MSHILPEICLLQGLCNLLNVIFLSVNTGLPSVNRIAGSIEIISKEFADWHVGN